MPGLAVVKGCTLQVSGAPEAVCQIVTLPSTKVKLGGAFAYSGPLTVQISGALMGGAFSATPGSGTATINPVVTTTIDGKQAITIDCVGTGTLSGSAVSGTSTVPVTLSCTVTILDAGQTKVNINK